MPTRHPFRFSIWIAVFFAIAAAPGAFAQYYSGTFQWRQFGGTPSSTGYTLYVPHNLTDANLRGVILWSNGSGEDRRYMSQVPWVQAFARAKGYAVIAAQSNLSTGDITDLDANLSAVLSAAATASGRASIVNAPLLPLGMSLGGIGSTQITGQRPTRVLAFASNKGTFGPDVISNFDTTNAAQPFGLMMPGETDGNNTANSFQVQDDFLRWRSLSSNTGRVAYAVDYNSGHNPDTGQSWDLACVLFAEADRLRHPGTPLSTTPGNPPTLPSYAYANGWLVERNSVVATVPSANTAGTVLLRPTFPQIAAVADYTGTPAAATTSWLPSRLAARAYRAFISTDPADINRTEAPNNQWLQIETPMRHQQFRTGETPLVTLDTRRWTGVTSMTFYLDDVLLGTKTDGDWSWQLPALTAGFHVLVVEATDGTNQRAAFVTFTAEESTGVPTNTWTGNAGTSSAATSGNWSAGVPAKANQRMTTFNADASANTDYATNGDYRVSLGALTADAFAYGFDFPPATSNRGFTFVGYRPLYLGASGLRNRDANTVTFDNAAGRIRLAAPQTWSAEAGDIVFTRNGDNRIVLGEDGNGDMPRNNVLTLATSTGRTITFNTPLTGYGTIIKSGPGLVLLNAANSFEDPRYYWDTSYQETVRVHGGTLRVGPGIKGLSLVNGGSGYTSATVAFSGGGGSGATANATVSNVVNAISITNSGNGYESRPTVSFSGGGGTGVTANCTMTVKSVYIFDSVDSNYATPPAVTFSGGGGTGAAATAVLTGNKVTAINVTNGGSGYTSSPNILLNGNPTSTTATNVYARAYCGVDAVNILTRGSGYTSSPTVTFTKGFDNTPPQELDITVTGTANLTGAVTGFTVTNSGSGYTDPSAIVATITGDGTGATASLLGVLADTNRLFIAAGSDSPTFDLNGDALTLAALTGGGTLSLGTTGSLTLQHKFEESIGNHWSPTDWRGTITGGTADRDTLILAGTVTNVDSDANSSIAGLAPSGTADMRLGGASTYAGRTVVNSGNLLVQSNAALGANGTGNETVVAAGAQTRLAGSGLVVAENFILNNTNGQTPLGNDSASTGTNTYAGTLSFPASVASLDTSIANYATGTTLAFTGTLTGQAGAGTTRLFIQAVDGATVSIPGVIANTADGGATSVWFQRQGSATSTPPVFRVSGASTFTGSPSLLRGTLLLAADTANSVAGPLGNNANALSLGASWGTSSTDSLSVLTDGGVTISKPINTSVQTVSPTYAGVITLGGNSAHTSTFSGTFTINGNHALALSAASGGRVNFTGQITDGGNTATLNKTGPGVVSLARAAGNTYDGLTTVSVGTLLANNTSGSATGTGAVTVASGATIGGSGIISGAVTLQSGAGLTFDVSTAAASHTKLTLSSTLALGSGGALTINAPSGGSPATGSYTLLSASSITGTLGTVTLPSGWTGSASVSGNNIVLNLTGLPSVSATPSGFTATVASASAINLNWTDVANELGYTLERSTSAGSGFVTIATLAANTIAYADSALAPVTTYNYRLSSFNNGGPSSVATASAATYDVAPSTPTNLVATPFDNANIDLAWTDASANETGFEIERSLSAGSGFSLIAITAANATTYRDSGRAALTTYYYRIRATNSGGPSAYTSVASATTPSDQIPSAPTVLSAWRSGDTQAILAWTDTSNAETGFKIERRVDAGSYSLLTTAAANATSYTDTNVTPGTAVTYRLKSTNANGDSAPTAEALAATPAWAVNTSGAWATASNWTSPFAPSGTGAPVTLGNGPATTTALRTLTLDNNVTLGALTADATLGLTSAGYIIQSAVSQTLTFDVTSGQALLANPSGASSLRINSPIVLADTLALTAASTGDTGGASSTASVFLSGALSGPGGIIKTGSGNVRFGSSAGQTFAGGVTWNAGTLILGTPGTGLSVNALGTGTFTLSNAAAHVVNHNNFKYSATAPITFATPATFANAISLNVASPSTSFFNWGIDQFNAGILKFTGPWSSSAAVTSDLIFNGGGATGFIYGNDASGLTFSGNGKFWLRSGTHYLAHAHAFALNNSAPIRIGRENSSTDSPSNDAALFLAGDYTVAANLALNGSGTNAANRLRLGAVTDAVTGAFNGTLTLGATTDARTVELWAGPAGAASTTRITYGGLIADGGTTAAYSLVKYGRGTAIFSAANTYDGTTTVNDGTLLINGNQSSANGLLTIAGPVSSASTTWVSGGGQGTTSFVVTSATGIVPGMAVTGTNIQANTFVRSVSGTTVNLTIPTLANLVAGTFGFSALDGGTLGGTGTHGGAVTVAAGGKLAFALTTNAASHDRFDVSGALTFSGNSTLTITATANATTGTYALINAAGGITGTLPTLVLPSNWVASLSQSGTTLNLVVTGTGTTPLQAWRQQYFGTTANNGSAADTYDYDGDGVSNLIEYALGGDPVSALSVPKPQSQILNSSLQITFTPQRGDITYSVEASSDLVSWSALVMPALTVGQPATVSDSIPVDAVTPRRFLRLRVTAP